MSLLQLFSDLWYRFFNKPTSTPVTPAPPAKAPRNDDTLERKILVMTGAFENDVMPPKSFSGLTGNFDGEGLSFGVLQWCIKQESLQPLLKVMISQYASIVRGIFKEKTEDLIKLSLMGPVDGVAWCSTIQDAHFKVLQPWASMFYNLGQTAEFQAIEIADAHDEYEKAKEMCVVYQLWSERALALMFDVCTQNGSIQAGEAQFIREDYEGIVQGMETNALEVRRMEIIANRVADGSRPAYREDVRGRKMCIVKGSGTVHETPYVLDKQFGISLKPYVS